MKMRIRPQVEFLEGRALLTAGALDASFGGTGIVTTSLTQSDLSQGVAVQPLDSKVILGGSVIGPSGNATVGLVRYNTDGTLDASFGKGGKSIPNPSTSLQYRSMALGPDGKIVSVGDGSNGSVTAWSVTRTNADGTPDTTFGATGSLITHFTSYGDSAKGVVVQPDDKIVVVGMGGSPTAWEVARYNLDGTLDTTFGVKGLATFTFTLGSTLLTGQSVLGVSLDGQGRILVSGTGYASGVSNMIEAARLTTTGALDTTFHGNGREIFAAPGASRSNGCDIGVQPSGQIIVSGVVVIGGTNALYAVRLNSADGSIDATFGPNGNGFSFDTRLYDRKLAIQSDGKLVLAGTTTPTGSNGVSLLRMTSNGALDSSFGNNGLTLVAAQSNWMEFSTGVALTPGGKIAVSAYDRDLSVNKGYFAALRFLGDTTTTTSAALSTNATPSATTATIPSSDPTLVPLVLEDHSFLDALLGRKSRRTH